MLKKKRATTSTYQKSWQGWLFISPVLLGIAFFTVLPMAESLYFSFFREYNVITPPKGFGLFNYRLMFLQKDFWQAVKVTGVYTVITIPLYMTLSFMLALLLNSKIKGVGIYRVLIYLPVIIPVTVSGIIWKNFTETDFGLANAIITGLGFEKFPFFDEAATSMPSLVIMGLWSLGGGMVLWLSSLKNVPQNLYEAAEIDGANGFVKLFRITIPMCTPMIFYNLIMNIIGSLQTFGSVMTLTGGSSGEGNSMLFYLMKVYNDAFNISGKTMGLACAESWFLFFIIAVLTATVFKTSRWVFYGEDN